MSSIAPRMVDLVSERAARDAVVDLLRFIGEDPNRDGLADTPDRVIRGEIFGRTGAGVIVRAHHLCMGCRGVRQPGADMITSSMAGSLRTDATTRSEFLRLCKAN